MGSKSTAALDIREKPRKTKRSLFHLPSRSFLIHSLHLYSRRLEAPPAIFLGALLRTRVRVPLYHSPRISHHSFVFPCPLRSPFPHCQAGSPPLARCNFTRRRDTGIIFLHHLRVQWGLCLFPRRSAVLSSSRRADPPRRPTKYKGMSGKYSYLHQ